MIRTIAVILGTAVGAATLSACGGDSKADAKLDEVTLRLGAIQTAKETPYFYGMEKGCFSDQKIKLKIAEGKGSSSTVQTVASGADDFGQADPATLIGLAAKGAKVKAVMSYLDVSPLSVLVSKKSGISSIDQLDGRKLAFTAGDSPSALFPALAKVNGLDEDKVTMANMNIQVKMTAILQGKVDGILGLNFMAANLSEKGLEADALLYSDNGVKLPGDVLMSSESLIKKDPDLVKRFVAAAACSKKAAIENPTEAVAAFTKANSAYPKEGAKKEFELVSQLFADPATSGEPVGHMSEPLFTSAYAFLTEYASVPTGKNVTDYFTNEFLPAG